jgi:tRNA threonylcarbamoyladenosine biosynthesis protein TsaB
MAFILSIETSAGTCSVALYNDALLIGSETVNEPQSHASRLAPLIQTLLGKGGIAAKSLNAVAISAGPGSYTGLRIGTSTAKGICVSLNIPLIAIPALDMLAHEAYARFAPVGLLCPMIDARRMEVYCQIYNTNFEILDPVKATVVDDSTFQELLATGKVFFFGNGAEKCKDVIRHPNAFFLPEILSNAETLGRMAYEKYEVKDFEDLTNFTPFYLKEFVAKKSKSLL